MKIIGYVRVSRDSQVESGLGLESQENICVQYAKKMGLEIAHVYRDEGLGGTVALKRRLGMLGAINALDRGDILVVAKRDRLGRDPLMLAMIESAISRQGARIVSASGEGTEDNDPSSILMRRMVDAFSEYERLITQARIKAAIKVKKDRGERTGHIPFGCKLAEDGIHLVYDEREQDVLSNMRKLNLQRFSVRGIVAELNRLEKFNRGSAKWCHTSVWRVMKSNGIETGGPSKRASSRKKESVIIKSEISEIKAQETIKCQLSFLS